ncbi:MAG: SBBP repeat-containing protein [Candidatus Odinarchaeota archaeon]
MRKKSIFHLLITVLLLSITLVTFSSSINGFTTSGLAVNSGTGGQLKPDQFFSRIADQEIITGELNDFLLPAGKDIQLPFAGFIQNLGQVKDDSVRYYLSTSGFQAGFSSSSVKFTVFPERTAVSLNFPLELTRKPVDRWIACQEEPAPLTFVIDFPGSSAVVPAGVTRKSHEINYFIGDLQLTGVPSWDELWYRDLYPGIDLRYYMSDQGLKYDFVVHPGADPGMITLRVSDPMVLAVSSDSVAIHSVGEPDSVFLQDSSLVTYQEDGIDVPARFISKSDGGQCYGFQVGSHDRARTLIIDPLWMPFSSYLGGGTYPTGYAITVDGEGNILLAFMTSAPDFSGGTGSIGPGGSYDILVAKFNSTGTGLLFSTYIGGSGGDYPTGIGLDASGNIYISAGTASDNIPVPNAYNGTFGGGTSYGDAYVAKLNAAGDSLLYGTYLGGSGEEFAAEIAVDGSGNCHVTGYTTSTGFPTLNAYDSTLNGYADVFVSKLDASGNLLFSTFLGGDDVEHGSDIDLDASGNMYLTGYTSSSNFPLLNAYNGTFGGLQDVFVTKMNSAGTGLLYSTFIGGSSFDWGLAIAVDGNDNAYITGTSNSSNFPLKNPYNSTFGAIEDVILLALNSTGNGLVFSTFLGGSNAECGNKIGLSGDGSICVTGLTRSGDFTLKNAYNYTHGGEYDVFVAGFNSTGNGLLFSTFLGGAGDDAAYALALDASGDMYISGYTASSDFPVVNSFNSTFSGGSDAFILKLSYDALAPSIDLVSPVNGSIHTTSVLIDLDIADDSIGIDQVLYGWNESANTVLDYPYDVLIPEPDGYHVLQVFANDTFGQWNSTTFFFVKDSTEPVITLASPVNNSILRSSVLINLSVSDNLKLSQVLYHWDGTADQLLEEPHDLALLSAEGQHVLQVSANDTAGNSVMETFVFTTDDTMPVIELSSPENNSIHNSGIIIDLNVTDNTGVVEFLYSWDGSDNVTLASPYPLALITGDGHHELQVFARDGAGNWASQAFNFTTDDTNPVIESVAGISQGKTVQLIVPVKVTASDEFGIDRVEILLDGTVVCNDTTSPYTWNWSTLSTADGTHAVTIRVIDLAGNVQEEVITVNVSNTTLVTVGLVAVLLLIGLPVFTLVYTKSYNLRNRKVINMYEKSRMGVTDIARATGKSTKDVVKILKKAKKMD